MTLLVNAIKSAELVNLVELIKKSDDSPKKDEPVFPAAEPQQEPAKKRKQELLKEKEENEEKEKKAKISPTLTSKLKTAITKKQTIEDVDFLIVSNKKSVGTNKKYLAEKGFILVESSQPPAEGLPEFIFVQTYVVVEPLVPSSVSLIPYTHKIYHLYVKGSLDDVPKQARKGNLLPSGKFSSSAAKKILENLDSKTVKGNSVRKSFLNPRTWSQIFSLFQAKKVLDLTNSLGSTWIGGGYINTEVFCNSHIKDIEWSLQLLLEDSTEVERNNLMDTYCYESTSHPTEHINVDEEESVEEDSKKEAEEVSSDD
jgi:hypothetical protein